VQHRKRDLIHRKKGLVHRKRDLIHRKKGLVDRKRGLLHLKKGLVHGPYGAEISFKESAAIKSARLKKINKKLLPHCAEISFKEYRCINSVARTFFLKMRSGAEILKVSALVCLLIQPMES
jgi:hypothetical protein